MCKEFKGIWIPSELWLNSDLKVMEKIFLVEIASLDGINGCYASNGYFSDFFDLSKTRCSAIIKSLQQKGYITIRRFYEDGKKSLERRIIKVNKEIIKAKCDRILRKKSKGVKPKESDANIEIESNKELDENIEISKDNKEVEEEVVVVKENVINSHKIECLNAGNEIINKHIYHSNLKLFMCRKYRILGKYSINYLYWLKLIKLFKFENIKGVNIMKKLLICVILSIGLASQLIGCSSNKIGAASNQSENINQENGFSEVEIREKAYEYLENVSISDSIFKDLILNPDTAYVEEFTGNKKELAGNEEIAVELDYENKEVYTVKFLSDDKLKEVIVYVDKINLDVLGVDLY